MSTIILMRHGETEANIAQIYQGQGNSRLSGNGKAQASAAACFLKGMKIDAIYCSDLTRSRDTARKIAKEHKRVRPRALKGLRERYYGCWEGLRFDEIEKKYGQLYKKWHRSPNTAKIPRAETLKELQSRAITEVRKLMKKHSGQTILIVGHGGINRTILFHFLGMPLDNFWKIKQDNCCINLIEPGSKGHKVSLLNSTCFLGELRLKKRDVLA